MSRPRKPTNILQLSGAFAKNPQRAAARAGEPIPRGEIGPPPDYLTEGQAQIWREMVDECPAGVMKNSDRMALENLCRMQERIRSGTDRDSDSTQVRIMLQQFGMTPASRSNVNVQREEDGNAFATA